MTGGSGVRARFRGRPRGACLGGLLLALVAACGESSRSAGDVDGAELYGDLCARCHGPAGEPTPSMVARYGVRDLTTPAVEEMTDAEIRSQIREGSKNHQMPSFGGAVSEAEVEAVVEHVRTLAEPSEVRGSP